jgi:hypothetical protein
MSKPAGSGAIRHGSSEVPYLFGVLDQGARPFDGAAGGQLSMFWSVLECVTESVVGQGKRRLQLDAAVGPIGKGE